MPEFELGEVAESESEFDWSSLPPSDNRPVFVVGAPRSGTTLLYHVLLSSGVFPVYVTESKVLACSDYYGPLHRGRNARRFLSDYLESRQFARSGLDAAEFEARLDLRNLTYPGFLRLLMDEIAVAQDKARWAEKTPAHIWYIGELADAFRNARFIHIVRDGRDVALSLRRLGWTHSLGGDEVLQLVEAALRWEASVRHGRQEGDRLGGRYLEIKYEDLVTEPEGTIERVDEFAGIRATMRALDSDHAGSLQSANTAFGSPMDGISDEAVGRWRRQLESAELDALQYAVGESLAAFGYEDAPSGSRPRMRVRAFARIDPAVRRFRKHLKASTPLSRMAGTPLEVGLT